jgi:hypothetical protein
MDDPRMLDVWRILALEEAGAGPRIQPGSKRS